MKHAIRRIGLAMMAALFAGSIQAATLTYVIDGGTLTGTEQFWATGAPQPEITGPFEVTTGLARFEIIIDTARLDVDLRGQRIVFDWRSVRRILDFGSGRRGLWRSIEYPWLWFHSWSQPNLWGEVSFDQHYNIGDQAMSVDDDNPSMSFSPEGVGYFLLSRNETRDGVDGIVYYDASTSEPPVWTRSGVVPSVPLPSGLPLLMAAGAGLGLLRRLPRRV